MYFFVLFCFDMYIVKSFEKDRQREIVYEDGFGSDGGWRIVFILWVGWWMILFKLNFFMVYFLGVFLLGFF